MTKILTTGVALVGMADYLLKKIENDIRLVDEPTPYVARPEFTELRDSKKRKECTYHEYTERKHKDDLGSVVKSDWACRHCGRIL
jgi:hypothetical protein